MNKTVRKTYNFESTHMPQLSVELDVAFESEFIVLYVEGVKTTVDFVRSFLRREDDEMIMVFDFIDDIGSITLKESGAAIEFEILESNIKFENENLQLDFKYVIGDEEMFVSMSII